MKNHSLDNSFETYFRHLPTRAFISSLGLMIFGCSSTISQDKPNILFISIDDLRPELGCYGANYVKSPTIDSLANQGILYTNAFCQLSHCSPSRSSLLTGLRPEECGVLDLKTHFREKVPNVITLPQHFKNNGYLCYAYGKVYHNDLALQDTPSWSEECWLPPGKDPIYAYALPVNLKFLDSGEILRNSPTEAADVPDNSYPDGLITDKVIEKLHQLKNSKEPFFIAAGYYKPHLPYNAPKKYWDMYDPGEIPLSPIKMAPEDSPDFIFRKWSEPGSYSGVKQSEPFSDSLAIHLKHGYLACVSYIDAQINRIVKTLDKLNLKEKTIIVIWGDHGYKLGEYGRWSKHSNLDIDTRVPLIISAPKQRRKKESKIVELIDIYPTLVNLAGLPQAPLASGVCLLSNNDKGFAISQIEHESFTGYSIRTKQYRYVVWLNQEKTKVIFKELYDLQESGMELKNIADNKDLYEIMDELKLKISTEMDMKIPK